MPEKKIGKRKHRSKKELMAIAGRPHETLPQKNHYHLLKRFDELAVKLEKGLSPKERKELDDLIEIKRRRLKRQMEHTQDVTKQASDASRAISEAEQMKINLQLKILRETELRAAFDAALAEHREAAMKGDDKATEKAHKKMAQIKKKLKALQKEKKALQTD